MIFVVSEVWWNFTPFDTFLHVV
jgi:hypothetical protein